MPDAAARRVPALIVATGGGLLFVAALLYFVVSYAWRFDALTAAAGGNATRIAVDLGIFSAFALHHSLFARTAFKDWIRARIPPALERSVYVWIASALFVITCRFWQPVDGMIWQVAGAGRLVLVTMQVVAGVAAVAAARSLDVLDLAGLRQVMKPAGPERPRVLDDRGLYGVVRHPIYLGWILLVWLTPSMSGTRFVFAAVSSFYLLVAIPFEERDLVKTFGQAYEDYRRRVPRRVIPYLF